MAAASTLGGLILISEPWDMHASLFSKFLGLMAALCWATGSILIKRLRSKTPVDLLTLTTWQMIIGAVPLILLALIVPEHPTQWSGSYIGILVFMSRTRPNAAVRAYSFERPLFSMDSIGASKTEHPG